MKIVKFNSFAIKGIEAIPVTVEVEVADGGVGLHLIGVPEISLRESLLRVVTAIQSLGYNLPGKKVIINVAPAIRGAESAQLDLPIALGILAASGRIAMDGIYDESLKRYPIFAGELGLDGSVRYVPGAIPALKLSRCYAGDDGDWRALVLPKSSACETAAYLRAGDTEDNGYQADKVYGINHLNDAVSILEDIRSKYCEGLLITSEENEPVTDPYCDLADIPGNEGAKRALEIAAAGGFGILLAGAPGSCRTDLALALNGILPPLTLHESEEVAGRLSVLGQSRLIPVRERLFRSPHFASSLSALLGGGTAGSVKPGELALAHNGVLELDDFNEFPKSVAEVIGGALQDGKITISRLTEKYEFPAKPAALVLSAPLCPCGYYGEGDRCTCTPGQRRAYLEHMSGRLLEQVTVQAVTRVVTGAPVPEQRESSADVAKRVAAARKIQRKRNAVFGKTLNSELSLGELAQVCQNLSVVDQFIERLGLNAGSFFPILRMARTIADLAGEREVKPEHYAEAASYRFLDRYEVADK